MKKSVVFASCILMLMGVIAFGALPAAAKGGQNGTTLAAYKTIDICEVTPPNQDGTGGIWRYSGEIAVWNQGAIDTSGFAITDCIQTKEAGGQYLDVPGLCMTSFDPILHEIAAGTTQATADVYEYWVEGAALDPVYIRNSAYLTILNHSGNIGTPYGPNPKATWAGGYPPPCLTACGGCTYTQGYWENHPESWPSVFNPMGTFYLATKEVCIQNCGGSPKDDVYETQPATCLDVLSTPVSESQGYYQLAHQYIAAVLNQASGACVPQGVQDTLVPAQQWLVSNDPSACTGPGSCGMQKDWAAVLDDYNNGVYPGGPLHCE
jgi:hypothetical protein